MRFIEGAHWHGFNFTRSLHKGPSVKAFSCVPCRLFLFGLLSFLVLHLASPGRDVFTLTLFYTNTPEHHCLHIQVFYLLHSRLVYCKACLAPTRRGLSKHETPLNSSVSDGSRPEGYTDQWKRSNQSRCFIGAWFVPVPDKMPPSFPLV